MKILAFVGMPGSGKSLAADFLKQCETKGFACPKERSSFGKKKIKIFRLGDLTDEELKKRGLPINEQNEKIVREELRQNFGMAVYAERVIEKVNKLNLNETEIVALDGVKSFEEYLLLKKEFGRDFSAIALVSNLKTRHSRLEKRKIRPLTKEQCFSRDSTELENLNEGSTIAMADYYILNENLTKKKLDTEINKILKKITRQKV